jgi:uncharacterized phage protein (TIGR02218 family)
MGRTIASEMQTELSSPLTRLAACWLITRTDGQVFAYADHDVDLTFGGVTYKAQPGFTRSAVRQTSDMSVDNTQVLGVIDDDSISESDLIAGRFDMAAINIYLVKWDDLTVPPIQWFAGTIGEIPKGTVQFSATLAGLSDALQDMVGTVYQPTCRHDFGDANGESGTLGCGADLVALTQNGTVTAVTGPHSFDASGLTGAGPRNISYTAKTISFDKATNAILDSSNGLVAAGFKDLDLITVSGSHREDGNYNLNHVSEDGDEMTVQGSLPYNDPAGWTITITTATPGYFDFGRVTWLTGLNAGLSMEVKTWDGTSALKLLFQMPYPVQAGDTFKITPGCDKRLPTCQSFGQILNFDGEAFVPGEDAALEYANAQ